MIQAFRAFPAKPCPQLSGDIAGQPSSREWCPASRPQHAGQPPGAVPGRVPACPPSNPTQGFEQISPASPVQLATLALAVDQRVSEGSTVWWGGMSREELLYPARGHCVSDTRPAQGSRGQRPKSPRVCFTSKDKSPA